MYDGQALVEVVNLEKKERYVCLRRKTLLLR